MLAGYAVPGKQGRQSRAGKAPCVEKLSAQVRRIRLPRACIIENAAAFGNGRACRDDIVHEYDAQSRKWGNARPARYAPRTFSSRLSCGVCDCLRVWRCLRSRGRTDAERAARGLGEQTALVITALREAQRADRRPRDAVHIPGRRNERNEHPTERGCILGLVVEFVGNNGLPHVCYIIERIAAGSRGDRKLMHGGETLGRDGSCRRRARPRHGSNMPGRTCSAPGKNRLIRCEKASSFPPAQFPSERTCLTRRGCGCAHAGRYSACGEHCLPPYAREHLIASHDDELVFSRASPPCKAGCGIKSRGSASKRESTTTGNSLPCDLCTVMA